MARSRVALVSGLLGVAILAVASTPSLAGASPTKAAPPRQGGPVSATLPRSSTTTTTLPANYSQSLRAYNTEVAAIANTFRQAVTNARSAYRQALRQATTSSQRSSALQTMEAAIIEAAAKRSAALVALGNPPPRP